jgi:hypothetical protein
VRRHTLHGYSHYGMQGRPCHWLLRLAAYFATLSQRRIVCYILVLGAAQSSKLHTLANSSMSFMHRASIPAKSETHDAGLPDRRLAQPFSGWNHERMTTSIDNFIAVSGLEDYEKYIRRGAFLAQSKAAFPKGRDRRDGLTLTNSERYYMDLESSPRPIDKFNQPWRLYALVGVCSLGAAVQGWYVSLGWCSKAYSDDRQG